MPAIMMADPGGGRLAPDHNHMQMQVAQAGHMDQEEQMKLRKQQDLETLRNILIQWNANRLDLFELSMPNEDLEFTGVMRFYYQAQDLGSGQKVATKCIRVSSTATNKQIIETLIEKFRPDMKMLEVPEYALYEIHESGERRLGLDEKPLLVQLNWHKDDREGRFLLRRIDEASHMPQPTQEDSSFKRKLSKREKKALKKQEKKEKVKEKENKDESMAEKLYTELPDTSFTRSISNPEAVMRRRRQQKLEKKLQQFRSKDGGPDTGGTLKIYGEALRKDVPYKTLLLSIRDTAANVVLEMLEKYGIDKRESPNYCLVQSNLTMPDDGGEGQVVGGGTTREYILEEEECPLNILMHHPASRGAVTFHVKRRPPDGTGPRRRKKKAVVSSQSTSAFGESGLPFLVELTPEGGDRVFKLQMSVTEVGSEVGVGGVQLPGLLPRHCVIAHTSGIVTVTPCSPNAEVVVNNQRAVETTILQHGATLRFGRSAWRFFDPNCEPQKFTHNTLPNNLPHHGSTATLQGQEQYQAGMRSSTANYVPFPPGGPPKQMGKDAILPAVLEFREDTEVTFFNALTIQLDPSGVNFKLAPTYTIYMATRFRASTHYRPELVPEERAVRLTEMLNRVSDMILAVIQQNPGARHSPTLSFWMANASELLHFLKSDRHITAFSLQAQDMLADAVHIAFKQLVEALQSELELVLPSLLSDQDSDGEQSTAGIISVFSSAMGLLRKCRVNAALTIQLFSQLFHFVNMWTFNTIVTDQQPGQPKVNYCTHTWGLRLKRRLAKVEIWAEKQGLELAADCHLARITQAAHLLQARKGTAEDIATLSSTCFKLNSLQLKSLLSRYQPAEHEAPFESELIDTIVRVAQNTADVLITGEGRQVRLEEDFVLLLPFLLPEDNYSCDIVRGVPGGLIEFLAPLQKAGLCVMTPQPTSSGYWTIYMDTPPPLTPVPRSPSEMSQVTTGGPEYGQMNFEIGHPNGPPGINGHGPINAQNGYMGPMNGGGGQNGPMGPPKGPAGFNGHMGSNRISQANLPEEPEIQTIRLSKTNGMGLSIVAAKGVGKERLGIYIKAVVEGGAAWQDGSLQAGDQLLAVDGQSLVGITQERAAEIMMRTGPVVTLEVAKKGAFYHGLAQLLSQPSPVMSRHNGEVPSSSGYGPAAPNSGYGTGPRRMSDRDVRGGPVGPPGPPPPHHHPSGPPQHMMHGGPPPMLPGRIPQSKSTPSLNASPGGESQHNYQNQEWLHHQVPPRQPPTGPGSRSTSIQNLSQPMNRPPQHLEHEQGFYQNLVQQGPHSQGGAPPPFHRPRFGSQTSLSGPPGRDRPMSAHYPMGHPGPPNHPQLTPQGSLHGSPLHQMGPNMPQGSFQRYAGPPGPRPVQPPLSSSGPEKPQRQFSYELEGQMIKGQELPLRGPEGPNRLNESHKAEPARPSQNRVRFQDPQAQESSDLSQLRLSAVEQEFRRRVEQYTSESEDEETKVSTIKRNGNAAAVSNTNLVEKDREAFERRIHEEKEREMKIEEKRKELEENTRQEERLLNEARRRVQTGPAESNGSTPPPLPNSPPPVETPPPAQTAVSAAPGTQRLDMLLGNTAPATLGRSKPKSETPTKRDKRVSFMPEEDAMTNFEYSSDSNREDFEKYDDNDNNISQENLDRLNAKEDPNAFIHEAETLLNSATIGLNKLDFNSSSTGHTPSVIGTQEIYKDPRSRMLLEQQEKKLSAGKPPDGAKLSFKEKMKLFAQEVGENTPRDKAKISKAQREIDGEGN